MTRVPKRPNGAATPAGGGLSGSTSPPPAGRTTGTRAAIEEAVRSALEELFAGPPFIAPNGVVIDGANPDLPTGTTVVGHITDKVMEAINV